ncbi:TsoY family (seleno)protein [Rhodovulum sp. DZ06]|uniref:TsoY family (seleno)protein n=1 Tax=Rhodovulum sp. DZ06 TaxID=3425126 RepID=UPI003D3485CC
METAMPFHALPRLGDRWSPLHFLAALGAGGIVVTFFLWFMFWVPHKGRPVPVFEDIAAAFASGGPATQGMIVAGYAGIVIFAILHIRLLAWNLAQYAAFKRTEAYTALRASNAETQLLAAPLTVAMSINMGFILGLVFVPGLWGMVEVMFPMALIAFTLVGAWALRLLGDFFGRVLTRGGFECAKNNSLGQMLPAFALAMIGVGLSAPAAMSQSAATAAASLVLSTLFITAASILGAIALFMGFRAMMEHGAAEEGAPTLLVGIPILTVIGIALMRQGHGLHVHLDDHAGNAAMFTLLARIVAAQVLIGAFGAMVLLRQRYGARFIDGSRPSVGAYALVCPLVAGGVMLQFFVNKGLAAPGLVDKYGLAYWAVTALALLLQAGAIGLALKLNARLLGPAQAPAAAA